MLVPRRRTKGPLDFDDLPSASASTPTSSNPALPPAATTPPPPTLQDKDLSFLLQPTNFHPLPTSSLLPPFLSLPAPPTATPTALLSTLHFRAAAIASAAALTSSPPPPSNQQILTLWYTRLLSLCLCHQSTLAAQELSAFRDVTAPFYLDADTGRSILPWELRVLAVALGERSDPRRAIGAYYELAGECRSCAADAALAVEERRLWRARLQDLGVRVANALVALGDLAAAVRHLKGLRGKGEGILPLLMVRVGMLEEARELAGDDEVLEALLRMADGEWEAAAEVWKRLPKDEVTVCNAAVCELYLARLDNVRPLPPTPH